ncbi:MAG TPA: CPBP family intramembrane metalloprotease, partial [Phycisphaerae bacterium]|nr:CPBP family intramembrane metalloprotease [Phycisphaerae bacterium]
SGSACCPPAYPAPSTHCSCWGRCRWHGSGVILAGLVAQLYTPDDSMTGIWSSISPAMAVVFVLTLSIVPGLVEELFFRGHIQRRLLLRWPPACAIAVQPCCLRSLTWT